MKCIAFHPGRGDPHPGWRTFSGLEQGDLLSEISPAASDIRASQMGARVVIIQVGKRLRQVEWGYV
jgi:hypothetical protein